MMYTLVTMFYIIIFILLSVSVTDAGIIGEECDWTGSGLDIEGRAVKPVYLRCRSGKLTWLYPKGALRLLFRLPVNRQDMNVCIRILREEPDYTSNSEIFLGPQISSPYDYKRQKRKPYPARLFLEGSTKLEPLYTPDDGVEKEVRCFIVKRGKGAVYMEADPEDALGKRVAELRYEAKPLPADSYDPAVAHCRPCSPKELSLAYCTSDLVTRANIISASKRPDLDTTQLTLRLGKVLRHVTEDGRSFAEDNVYSTNQSIENTRLYYRYDVENDLEQQRVSRKRRRRRDVDLHAHVQVSAECGAGPGPGDFMFMARRRLGRLTLVCAPRLDEWMEIANRMNDDGSAHCILEF